MGSDFADFKILVVDDEADARDMLRQALQEWGAQVLTAGSAQEALQSLLSERPALLFTDIGMPEMDGYELIRRVRALPASGGGQITARALTAFARAEDRSKALSAGFQEHMSKPWPRKRAGRGLP